MMMTYLVGGAVRDHIMGIVPKDRDYVVVGASQQDMLNLGYQQVGASFPVFLHPETREEYALARVERKVGVGHTGFEFSTENVTLEDDLIRRDLTINAIAMHGNTVIDPYHGVLDIENKILRHTSTAFREDPLRVLRVARFAARYPDFVIAHETVQLCKDMVQAGELDHLTPERIWMEVVKALESTTPSKFFYTLMEFGYQGVFSFLYDMRKTPQPPEHHPEGDVLVHTMLCLDHAANAGYDVYTRFAVLLHDIGKAPIYAVLGTLHGHEDVGVKFVDSVCEQLKTPTAFTKLARLVCAKHTHLHNIKKLNHKTVHALITDNKFNTNELLLTQYINACISDSNGRGFIADYRNGVVLRQYVQAYNSIDRAGVVSLAMSRGRTGVLIGNDIRQSELAAMRKVKEELKNE